MKIIDNISGNLFPETAGEDSGNSGIANPHISVSNSTLSPCPGESSNILPSNECDPAPGKEIVNSDHQDERGQRVDPHEAVTQPRPNDLISSLDDAGESKGNCHPTDTAATPSNNSELNDCDGVQPRFSGASDRIEAVKTSSSPTSHDKDEKFVDGETVSSGEQPIGCISFGASCDDSPDLNSLATSKEFGESELSNDVATEPSKPTDPARSDSEVEHARHEHSTAARLDEVGANFPMGEQSQTAGPLPEVGGSEHACESEQIDQGASVSREGIEVPTPATDKSKPKKSKRSHPRVIVKERDCLSEPEEEILDRLKALNAKQHQVHQNYAIDEVEAGYADLQTAHATCTKSVYRNIPKLIDKGFIDRVKEGNEVGAGSRARYRVVPEDEVKKRRLDKRLTHWVQIGSAHKAVPDPEESNERDDC